LTNPARLGLAGAAFLALFLFHLPFPLVILLAGLIGWIAAKLKLQAFVGTGHGAAGADRLRDEDSALGVGIPDHARGGFRRSAAVAAPILLLWTSPTFLLALLAPKGAFASIALFFSKMALLTFGGAYAVLAWVGQAAVDHYHWLSAREMLDGLGLAESTPGPLIMVTQYVGFIAAFRNAGGLPPLLAATLGGLLTTWVTFLPCFLWVLAGAPYVERLRSNQALSAALAAITAAVVGVILNLAFWFALHFWFARLEDLRIGPLHVARPHWDSVDPFAILLSIAALTAVLRFRVGTFAILGGCAAAGLLRLI
jgi:chromate transporter